MSSLRPINQKISKKIAKLFLLAENFSSNHPYFKLESESFQNGWVELIDQNENFYILSVAQCYIQNGDVMRDPEIIFAIEKRSYETWKTDKKFKPIIFPMSSQMDGTNFRCTAMEFKGDKVNYSPAWIKDIKSFLNIWIPNIFKQFKIK